MTNQQPCASTPLPTHTAQGFPLSEEQLSILQFFQSASPSTSLLVDSCAGASKTTTLVEVCHILPRTQATLALAFNKSIADELRLRVPEWIASSTINALGHRSIRDYFRANLKLDTRKVSRLWQEHSPYFTSLDRQTQADICRAYSSIKEAGSGYAPPKGFPSPVYPSTTSPEALFEDSLQAQGCLEVDLNTLLSDLPEVFRQDFLGIQNTQTIDFTDQIWLPACFKSFPLPTYSNVIVDEAQDLSPLNHRMLKRLVSLYPRGRLIAFGDRGQAIYAFRGADYHSFDSLAELFAPAETRSLAVSFRCPQAVVEEASKIDSRIRAWSEAPEGWVNHYQASADVLLNIPNNSVILCRLNAPLLQLAILYTKNLRTVEFLGRDLERQLASFLKRHAKKVSSYSGLSASFDLAAAQITTKPARERFDDYRSCIEAVAFWKEAAGSSDPVPIIFQGLTELFQAEGSIQLATIHRAKGLEWEHVGLLRPDLIPHPLAESEEDIQQELNMKYVAITRAQQSFTYLHQENK